MTSPIFWLIIAPFSVSAVFLWKNTIALVILALIFIVFYLIAYIKIVKFNL